MGVLWDRDYLEQRLARSRWLAAKATMADIRALHLRYASHYQRIIDDLAA